MSSQMAAHSSLGDGGVPVHTASPVANGGSKPCAGPSPIAIIGMACRTPGQVSNPEDLWQMCAQGRSGWSEFPGSRFNHEAFYHPNPAKAGCVRAPPSTFNVPAHSSAAQPEGWTLLEGQHCML